MLSLCILPCHPYRWRLSLAYLRRRAGELVDRVEGSSYRRLLHTPSGLVLLDITEEGGVLRVTVPYADGAPDAAALVRHVRRVFSLDLPLEAFYRAVALDPAMAMLTERFCGLRPVLTASPFESLIWAIIGQQITLTFAFRLKERLVRRYGEVRLVGGTQYYAFPTAEALARAGVGDLRGMQYSERKAAYIVDLARQVAGGLDLEAIGNLEGEQAVEQLTRIRGVGRWTAEYALLRGYGFPDMLPAADIGLRNAITRVYGLDHQATEAEVRRYGERWRGWRSIAATYLWSSLQAEANGEETARRSGHVQL